MSSYIYRFSLSKSTCRILKICMILPIVYCTLSTIVFACGFLTLMELHGFLYSFAIILLNFSFLCPNSSIISDSCNCIGAQVCILVEMGFPLIFKQDFVPFVVCVFLLIVILLLISFMN